MRTQTSLTAMLAAEPDGPASAVDPRSTPGVTDRRAAERELVAIEARLGELQERLFAEGTRSMLVVLQGMDTSGKGGTVRHVMSSMDPAGGDVAAFKEPTEEELAHHFLWRIEQRLPRAGEVVVFDRSHYEDVLIVRVRELVEPEVWRPRFEEINVWEAHVRRAGTVIVKCFLHISYDEQRSRLLKRLANPDKHWKFNGADIDERRRWDDYMVAYDDAIARCSTEDALWYVVPADRKWYRNWAVARLLVETLEAMDPHYPDVELDVKALSARLQPPG